MILLYWSIGRSILRKQKEEGWGAKVIDRMAKDLKEAFPDMNGFSPRNIKYMRKFAECWTDSEIVQRVVAQIPWRTNISLMDKIHDADSRIWYARKVLENGWSKTMLDMQIESGLIDRVGKSINNFPVALPPLDSDMANQVFKDPYLFDFLGTDMPRREVEIEKQTYRAYTKVFVGVRTRICFCWTSSSFRSGRTRFLYRLIVLSFKTALLCGNRIKSL